MASEQTRARNRVAYAIRHGTLVRPKTCSRCGSEPKAKDGRAAIQGHHADYSKPLDVEWICAKCHMQETPTAKGDFNSMRKYKELAAGSKNGQSDSCAKNVTKRRRESGRRRLCG